jgi:hypothetical protein
MKHCAVFLFILVLLVACVKPAQDPAVLEQARIEQLYKDIDLAIVAGKYEAAKSLLSDVKDETKRSDFYKRIILKDVRIENAADYLDEIESPGFLSNPKLKSDLMDTLDDVLETTYTYQTLFNADQRSYINVLAVTSYDILRENNQSHDAIYSFLSNFIRELNSKTNYSGFDFVNDTILVTDATKIMTDAFGKPDFTDFEKIGGRVDVSFYGIGGPVGSVEFTSMDIQPEQILLVYVFTRYAYDGSVYAVTDFELTVRYNPSSMFGLTILGFRLLI